MTRAALPAVALAAALTLTGCSTGAGTPDTIGTGTATALQQEVRHIADLAAGKHYPAALAAAGALQSDLRAAVETGRVPGDRAKRIQTALYLVETDLRSAQTALKPTTTKTATPAPTRTATATPTRTPTAAPAQTASADQQRLAKQAAEALKKAVEQQQYQHKRGWGHRGGKGKGD